MRTIKFRAWDEEIKTMFANETIEIDLVNNSVEAFTGVDNKLPNGDTNHGYVCLKISDLMQFTGLKDMNGKEIYEGDIVAIQTSIGRKPIPTRVFWEHGSWNISSMHRYGHLMEVLGNIYENPELLEKK